MLWSNYELAISQESKRKCMFISFFVPSRLFNKNEAMQEFSFSKRRCHEPYIFKSSKNLSLWMLILVSFGAFLSCLIELESCGCRKCENPGEILRHVNERPTWEKTQQYVCVYIARLVLNRVSNPGKLLKKTLSNEEVGFYCITPEGSAHDFCWSDLGLNWDQITWQSYSRGSCSPRLERNRIEQREIN